VCLKTATEVLVLITEFPEDFETGKPVNSWLAGPTTDRAGNIFPERIIRSPNEDVELSKGPTSRSCSAVASIRM
jgi:hypothetical protein